MKFSSAIFLSIVTVEAVRGRGRGRGAKQDIPKPEVTLGVSSDGLLDFANGALGGIEPSIKWGTSGSFYKNKFDWEVSAGLMNKLDGPIISLLDHEQYKISLRTELTILETTSIQAGIEAQIDDLSSMPAYRATGTVKRTFRRQNIKCSARGMIDSEDVNLVDFKLNANGPSTSGTVIGSADLGSRLGGKRSWFLGKKQPFRPLIIRKLKARQSLDLPVGRIQIAPRYSVEKNRLDCSLEYDIADTCMSIDTNGKRLSISQSIGGGGNDVLSPFVSLSDGDCGLTYSRNFGGIGQLTASANRHDGLDLRLDQGQYLATARITGFSPDDVDFSFKSKLDL